MSIETPSWKTGAAHASVRRRAIVLRIEVSATTSTSPSRRERRRRRGRSRRRRGAFSTSSATMRPSGPVPASAARSTPRSRAIRRASGDALIRAVRADAHGSASLVAARGRPASARRSRLPRLGGLPRPQARAPPAPAAALPSPSSPSCPITAIVEPTSTSPSGDDDLEQDAVEVGLDLLRHLVGVELVERLALLDGVALGLEPADDRAGLHALPEPGQLDLGRHHAQRRDDARALRLSGDRAHGRHYADAPMKLVDQWRTIEAGLPDGWEDVRLTLTTEQPGDLPRGRAGARPDQRRQGRARRSSSTSRAPAARTAPRRPRAALRAASTRSGPGAMLEQSRRRRSRGAGRGRRRRRAAGDGVGRGEPGTRRSRRCRPTGPTSSASSRSTRATLLDRDRAPLRAAQPDARPARGSSSRSAARAVGLRRLAGDGAPLLRAPRRRRDRGRRPRAPRALRHRQRRHPGPVWLVGGKTL